MCCDSVIEFGNVHVTKSPVCSCHVSMNELPYTSKTVLSYCVVAECVTTPSFLSPSSHPFVLSLLL